MAITTTPSKKKGEARNAEVVTKSDKFDLGEYFRGVAKEFKQISWPSRQQIIAETIVVIILVTLFSLFIYGVDKVLMFIVSIISP